MRHMDKQHLLLQEMVTNLTNIIEIKLLKSTSLPCDLHQLLLYCSNRHLDLSKLIRIVSIENAALEETRELNSIPRQLR